MNRQRRREIESVIEKLEELKSAIEGLRDDEQDYYDNMPENFQFGEKGELAEEAITNMEDAINSLEDVIGSLESAAE